MILAVNPAPLSVPDWVKDAVFYQIFPERFSNGDMGNDPPDTKPWQTKPENENMMGGDLQGITQNVNYLTRLGVNALYLNPIFTAPSNHKYNTTDYENVDPQFGGNKAFDKLVDTVHKNGMRVILDGVFNHLSHQHPWFKNVREEGPKSPYFNRFFVRNWPITYTRNEKGELQSSDYTSWWNYATIPVLNTKNNAVREYFLTGKDAIVKRWIKEGKIDGWRMDVADDSNFTPDYWRTARQEIKSVNKDAYMVAENWKDASEMLQGDQFDGSMNYQYFTWPAVDFFAKKEINADEFVRRLGNNYSQEAKFGAFNILDSHDTERFITQAGGDWYRQRPAAIFQMTYQGAPVVYYGDEIAMEGGKDPDSRRSMQWQYVPKENGDAKVGVSQLAPISRIDRAKESFNLYQKLIATRKQEVALRRGDFEVLATHNDNSTIAYRRAVKGIEKDAIIAINNSVSEKDIYIPVKSFAPDGTRYTDALKGASYTVQDGALQVAKVDGNYGAVLIRNS